MFEGREDEELLLEDVSGTETVVPDDADDELCEELVDGFFTVDEPEDGFLTVAPAYQSFFSTPLVSI